MPMKWLQQERAFLSDSGYSILPSIRGFDIWYQKRFPAAKSVVNWSGTESGGQYGVLFREISTLEKAKEMCEAHKAQIDVFLKQLDAEFVK